MHIEHLSHWSGHLNREMYVNRYGHGGIPVVSLLPQVVATMSTMILE